MTTVDAARGLAAGRVVLGAALLAAPAAVGRPWIGAAADRSGTQVALRALGVRDALLGGIALHLVGRGGPAGGRALQACAVADAVDFAATLAARRELPPVGAAGVMALAGAAAVGGAVLGRALSA
jgi:hypothetical protein